MLFELTFTDEVVADGQIIFHPVRKFSSEHIQFPFEASNATLSIERMVYIISFVNEFP